MRSHSRNKAPTGPSTFSAHCYGGRAFLVTAEATPSPSADLSIWGCGALGGLGGGSNNGSKWDPQVAVEGHFVWQMMIGVLVHVNIDYGRVVLDSLLPIARALLRQVGGRSAREGGSDMRTPGTCASAAKPRGPPNPLNPPQFRSLHIPRTSDASRTVAIARVPEPPTPRPPRRP